MEVRFGLRSEGLNFDPRSLLEAARNATVPTFGWPFGIFAENGDKPKPTKDGIVSVVEADVMGKTFDYWAIRSSGDFYLQRTLFEDQREPEKGLVFFNTRIAHTVESLMYCRSLYTGLKLEAGQKIDFRLAHMRTGGRKVTHSDPGQRVPGHMKGPSHEDAAEVQVSFEHPISDAQIVDTARLLLDPLFISFDFFQPGEQAYKRIGEGFIRGVCL
jgi:hypothetical protein